MKARKFLLGLVASVMSLSIAPAVAAELEASAGVDLVSSYVWRGAYQGQGAALQPGMGIAVGGFTIDAWGSTPLDASAGKELDFTVGYEFGCGLSLAVTDYWWEGEGAKYFTYDNHYLEVALGYTISEDVPLTFGIATMVAGADEDFSTYISVDYGFGIGAVDANVFAGITPWSGIYNDGFGVASVGISFSYDLVSSDKFSLPIFVETSFSPCNDNAYIVAGLSFAL
ncbi:MAG: hypothetical protein SNH35_05155 [Rikenellaceae bacterium]